MKRKVPFVIGSYYHIFNRGVDKRNIFCDEKDFQRFLQSIKEFNVIEPIGSIYENSFKKSLGHPMSKSGKLVDFVCFCINPNHFHFLLTPVVDGGIEKFMQKFSNGYTKYFNHKNERSGSLFQGAFKSVHVNSDQYLSFLSAYINLNYNIHHLKKSHPFVLSSLDEYIGLTKTSFCNKDIILSMFPSINDYKNFAKQIEIDVIQHRSIEREDSAKKIPDNQNLKKELLLE